MLYKTVINSSLAEHISYQNSNRENNKTVNKFL